MVRFSIFGIPVIIQPFFWVTLGIIAILWNPNARQGTSPDALLEVALFILAGFISILVHELGHALTARKFGAQSHIVLQSMGGYASYPSIYMTRTRSFLITAAGPAIQIALALVVGLIISSSANLTHFANYFLTMLWLISWVWAVFNLIPVLPLDGGRLVESLLGPQRIKTTLRISFIIAASLAVLGLITGELFITVIMGMFGWQSWKALQEVRGR